MAALSQARVSAPTAVRIRFCRGVRRGGERDVAAVGGAVVSADAVELSQGPGSGQVLAVEVGGRGCRLL